MVEKKDAAKKRKRRKAKAKPRVGQIISQKVVVNVGKDVSKPRRRTGTQAKRSVQPQQVVYQNAPIPLQPNYSSQINDLRDEVRTHLSGVNKEEGRRRANELRVEEGKQSTAVQTERQDMQSSGFQTTEPRKPPPPPRKIRSDSGVPRGELMRTAEKRANERGFSLVSTEKEEKPLTEKEPEKSFGGKGFSLVSKGSGLSLPKPALVRTATPFDKPALVRTATPPRIERMLERISENTAGRKKGSTILKKQAEAPGQQKLGFKKQEAAEEAVESKPGTFV
tara:strand:+ start:151 stop:990 length:840 start_codon:yes stop_codon:yes gene_type:complete